MVAGFFVREIVLIVLLILICYKTGEKPRWQWGHGKKRICNMTIAILHGLDGHAGMHWQQWLHDELVRLGYTVIMPTLPDSHHPSRTMWLDTLENLVKDTPREDLILVGHSLGVTTALDFIEKQKGDVRALVSASGLGKDYGAELNSYFMREREIDFVKVRQQVAKSFVFYGDDDPYVPQEILADLAVKLDVAPTIIPHGGHLNTDAGFATFPEILEVITTYA